MKRKVPVSVRAIMARINRALAKEGKHGEALRTCREDSRWASDLGRFYVVDLDRNTVTAAHVDLEGLAIELGVLKPYEALN